MAFLEYSDGEHRYFADGKELASVTQILDAAGLISPFCKDEEARYRGSRVHEICADDDVASLDLRKVSVDLRGYLRAWRKFRTDTNFKPSLIEQRVDCLEHGYSGRFDRLGFLGSDPMATILDIKTAKAGAVPAYTRLQTVAYGYAFHPQRVFSRMAVSLRPDGLYKCAVYPVAAYYIDRAEWLQLVRQHKENVNGHSKTTIAC